MIDRYRVRPAFAAFPAAVAGTWLVREFFHGVGVDEMSLLAMGQALAEGSLPYAAYWDVRMPLAYLWGWVSVHPGDAVRSVATLRLLAWFAQIGAVWLFFCLFQRTLGKPAAAVGAMALAAAANATPLHTLGMPNHFAMAMSVAALACVVSGLRGGRGGRVAYLASALLAGALPWTMQQAGLCAAGIGALALFGTFGKATSATGDAMPAERSTVGLRVAWLVLAALPSGLLFAIYAIAGHFDVFARTVFVAPLEVVDMRGGGYHFFTGAEIARLLNDSPWVVLHILVLLAGICWLPGAIRAAPPGSALRASAYLAAPTAAGFALMAYAKPPAPPEYWIEFAPVVGLLCAVAVSKVVAWGGWSAAWIARRARPAVLKPCLATYLGCALVLPTDPWASPPESALPQEYCDGVERALAGLGPNETVLDVVGLCSFQILNAKAALHPPFTFTPMWLRQLDMPWVGITLGGDGSRIAAVERLRNALASDSSVGAILADGRLLGTLREAGEADWEGWQRAFHAEWRMVWFRRVDGRETGEKFARLAIFVRR